MDAEEQAIRRTLRDVSSGISFDFEGLQDQIQDCLPSGCWARSQDSLARSRWFVL